MLAFSLVVFVLLVVDKSKMIRWPSTRRFMCWLSKKAAICFSSFALLLGFVRKVQQHLRSQRLSRWTAEKWALCLSALINSKLSTHPTLHRFTNSLSRNISSWKQSDRYIMARNAIVRFFARSLAKAEHFHHTANYTETFQKFLIIAFYIIFSCIYIYWFSIFSQDLAWFATMGQYSHTWNFGQVVALTVWAPPVCEYIHLELRKSHIKNSKETKLL